MVMSPFQSRARVARTMLPLFLSATCWSSAYPQTVTPVRHDACADGIVSYQGGVNGQIRICGAILQSDPKLSGEVDQIKQMLSQQQAQLGRLTRSINSVGSNLDLTRQTQMLQTLIAKLSTNPDTATARAEHLATALEGVETQITTARSNPAEAVVLRSKLGGSLGDAIAQLDTGEAVAELNDIRAEIHKIDETTARTEKDVRDIRRTIDIQLHPEIALPPEEGKLYTQMSPLMMEVSQFWQQWQSADMRAYQKQLSQPRATTPAANGFQESVQQALSPMTADYQQKVLPQLNTWRGQLVKRTPSLSDIPAFDLVTDQAGMLKAQQHLNILIQRYAAADPVPSLEVARQAHELQAKLANLSDRMREAYKEATMEESERRKTYVSTTTALPRMPGQVYDESVDGPLQKEFLADLEPRLRAWQTGVKKFFPEYKVTEFSVVRTSHELQEAQVVFNQQVMRVYQKIAEQIRSASTSTP